MEHKIDVIIPAFRAAGFIKDCLDSLEEQTYADWHALVILNQDGFDATMGILGPYIGKDNRISAIHLQRGDLSSAVNTGVSLGSAPYIAMLDADDVMAPNCLEIMMRGIQQTNADMAMCEISHFQNASDFLNTCETGSSFEATVIAGEERWNFLTDPKNKETAVVRMNKLYRRSVLKNIWYPSGHMHEDEYCVYDVYKATERICYIPHPLYGYRTNNTGSITSVPTPSKLRDACIAYRHVIEHAVIDANHVVVVYMLKRLVWDVCFRYAAFDSRQKDARETKESFLIARGTLAQHKHFLSVLDATKLDYAIKHPEAAVSHMQKAKNRH